MKFCDILCPTKKSSLREGSIMKKTVTLFGMVMGIMVAGSAVAAPSYLVRDDMGGYRVTYDYYDSPKTGWYIGGNAGLALWNWKNKYALDADLNANSDFGSDSYSMESVFTGGVQFGRRIKYFWRAEIEAGWRGQFTDKDPDAEFTMNIPYTMINGYYDFNNGLYLGAGAGVAFPTTTWDGRFFDGDKRSKSSAAAIAGLYLGWSHKLDNHLVLDLRYRLSGMTGFKHRVDLTDNHWFENKIDSLMDNSFTLGVRYEF